MQAYLCQKVDYDVSLCWQKELVNRRKLGEIEDTLLLLEHPPTYTMGSDQKWEHLLYRPDVLREKGFSIHSTNRGGDITYHGPGQLVVYPIIHLREAGLTPIGYVRLLEKIILEILSLYHITGQRKEGFPGVWIEDRKICAIGIGVSRGITFHGFAFNVNPDLSHFLNIIPCGLAQFGVASLAQTLGVTPDMTMIKQQTIAAFEKNMHTKCKVYYDQLTIGGVNYGTGTGTKPVTIA